MDKQEKWDRHFLNLCLHHAKMSKDPSTQVGSVIVGPDLEILSAGFNGFPRGITDTKERLNDRPTKYKLVVHGEMNAILAAARNGIRLKNATLYLAAFSNNKVWGSAPCTRCTVELIQSGIKNVVSVAAKCNPNWEEDCNFAKDLLKEANINYREVSLD